MPEKRLCANENIPRRVHVKHQVLKANAKLRHLFYLSTAQTYRTHPSPFLLILFQRLTRGGGSVSGGWSGGGGGQGTIPILHPMIYGWIGTEWKSRWQQGVCVFGEYNAFVLEN